MMDVPYRTFAADPTAMPSREANLALLDDDSLMAALQDLGFDPGRTRRYHNYLRAMTAYRSLDNGQTQHLRQLFHLVDTTECDVMPPVELTAQLVQARTSGLFENRARAQLYYRLDTQEYVQIAHVAGYDREFLIGQWGATTLTDIDELLAKPQTATDSDETPRLHTWQRWLYGLLVASAVGGSFVWVGATDLWMQPFIALVAAERTHYSLGRLLKPRDKAAYVAAEVAFNLVLFSIFFTGIFLTLFH